MLFQYKDTIPFGPYVDLTKSPTAMAPTKADFDSEQLYKHTRRAFSALSSVAFSWKIWTGAKLYKISFQELAIFRFCFFWERSDRVSF